MLRLIFFVFVLTAVCHTRADWQQQRSPPTPGNFPPPRPMTAIYRCGWSGIPAADINVSYSWLKNDVLQLDAKGGTTGFARTLWRLDMTHTARANASTLRPRDMQQVESYRGQTLRTELEFDENGVNRLRKSDPPDKNPPKRKRFDLDNLYDLNSALLFLRSQKLQQGQTLSVAVYPATSAYLATVRVLGREKIKVRAGTFSAIKLDLKLQKITGSLALEPHEKFRRATAWISDDNDRLVLKIEAEIFVGSVWAELERVRFSNR